MNIKVLGSGCKNCKMLYEHTLKALDKAKVEASVDYVTDMVEIAKFNLMRTPGLVINGKVRAFGKVLSEDEIIDLIERYRGE